MGRHKFTKAEFIASFWSKVDVKAPDACWLWLASVSGWYGKFTDWDGHIYAHRFSMKLSLMDQGVAMPGNLRVLHNCPGGDNPLCVNPAHLWLGTNAQNSADMVKKGRQAKGIRHGSKTKPDRVLRGEGIALAKLTDDLVMEIRERAVLEQVSHRKLALEYGVRRCTISKLIAGDTWTHLPLVESLEPL